MKRLTVFLKIALLPVIMGAGLAACSDQPAPESTAVWATPPMPTTAARSPTPPSPTPPPTATPSPAITPSLTPTATPAWWQPPPRTTWQIQLNSGNIDLSFAAQAYDVDLFDTPTDTIARLHQMGRRAICYFSAGTYEDWRPDADRYLGHHLLGKPLEDWEGEWYVDIRRMDVLGPILSARLDLAAKKGCDAVDPDNVQGYQEDTGFDLTPADQLTFNRWLAEQTHARGLGVGLKNDREQIPHLVDDFDFAVDEECFAYGECEPLHAFVDAGKAVFEIEYDLTAAAVCPQANAWGFSALLKPWDLSASRYDCLQDYRP